MSTHLNSPVSTPRALSGEGWAAIAGAVGSAFLLVKKLLGPRPPRPEPMSRADFYAEMLEIRERLHAGHLAMLEKLDVNHRELLAALERLSARVNALEAGVARLDERTAPRHAALR
ncbi:MAG TPA: hypothetical protein PKI20_13000 [Verrucomicrobiota bacterium]|jgi:hypothetical protein|nr:hypothetical protein [Verrucomicrobiota bacterium]HQL78624.1 hypothetical protein [Verrucomicrobiota bacterium]